MLDLKEGDVLAGRYTLVRKLGAGGMSILWLADDRRTESRVALKFASTDSSTTTALLQKEWRIGSRLMHASIIRVFEFHENGDNSYYAMQYINGPNIDVLAGGEIESILRPIGLIADALRYAHGKELVHRDIKASNILLDSRGAPYLVDFGIAAISGSVADGSGTPIALSPQQRAGHPPAPSDDIYALGVLLHELVSGHPPASADIDPATIKDAHGKAVPHAIAELIADMLTSDTSRRPSADVVGKRLEDAGFPAGAAPAQRLGNPGLDLRPLQAETIQLQRHRPLSISESSSSATASDGVSHRVLYGGLGLLLFLVLGVIFLLPAAVEKNGQRETDSALNSTDDDRAATDGHVSETDDGRPGQIEDSRNQSAQKSVDGQPSGFSENRDNVGGSTAEQIKAATDEALGDLLSRLQRLRQRGIERWGGQTYLSALDVYAEGDKAYVAKDYKIAGARYRETIVLIDPFFAQIDDEFNKAMSSGREAFDRGDHVNAVQSFDLAVAISPGNREAEAGLARALNLKSVLELVDQAVQFESNLELDAARIAFEHALQLDALWQPAIDGLKRIKSAITQLSFDTRMTEGFEALAAGDFASAKAAFNAAKGMDPDSRQPLDGLQQVDQEIRLAGIRRLEANGLALEANEEWENAIGVYEEILKIDGDLQFAKQGLAKAKQRAQINQTLNTYIDDPDSLSAPATMQAATKLLLDLSRISPAGPRLIDQKSSLSRLLKRAATPLDVMLVSDGATGVSILRVAQFGAFQSQQLSLRPGVYVAVGVRAGYRDVRIEFRVAPEIEMKPIVVQCEEQI